MNPSPWVLHTYVMQEYAKEDIVKLYLPLVLIQLGFKISNFFIFDTYIQHTIWLRFPSYSSWHYPTTDIKIGIFKFSIWTQTYNRQTSWFFILTKNLQHAFSRFFSLHIHPTNIIIVFSKFVQNSHKCMTRITNNFFFSSQYRLKRMYFRAVF